MKARELAEDYIKESEISHRLSHLYLKPMGRYNLYEEKESKKLSPTINVNIKNDNRTAIFTMQKLQGTDPALFAYIFTGFVRIE